MDAGRRALLKALAVAGLAGCVSSTPRPSTVTTTRASPTPVPTRAATHGPTPSPTASVAASPAVAPTVRPIVARELLGLPAPAGGEPHSVTGLMLHHTATPVVAPAAAPGRFRAHARQHRAAGFVDIAYHIGVDTGGTVYQLRDETIAGETFTAYDPAGWFLVVCEGDFSTTPPTPAMLAAVADVFAAASTRHDVDPATLVGHRDRAVTACPGNQLQARLPDLVAMVEQRLATGGVVLEVSDDRTLLP